MVVMPMTEGQGIDQSQIVTQRGGIGSQGLPLPRIEQDPVPGHCNPYSKAVFRGQTATTFVVDHNRDVNISGCHCR